MPYKGEKASPTAHVALLRDPSFAAVAKRWVIRPDRAAAAPPKGLTVLDAGSLGLPNDIELVVAIDGSNIDSAIDQGCTVIATQIGVRAIRLAPYLASAGRHGRPVDLDAFRASKITDRTGWLMAGSGCIPNSGGDGFDLWRQDTYEAFTNARAAMSSTWQPSLVDALMLVHGGPGAPSGTVRLDHCPYGCSSSPLDVGPGGDPCPTCGRVLYPTDVLRCHEEYESFGPNATPANRLMLAGERLLCLLHVDHLYRSSPEALARTMFFTDGPLAFYGPTAPMHTKWLSYWSALSREPTGAPTLVGIEKTGAFVEHGKQIARFFAPRQFAIPSVDYIVNNIRPGRGRSNRWREFGSDEYYGRHVFYKNASGAMLTLTIPRGDGSPYGAGDPCAPSEYPQLATALAQLDKMQSSMYSNALFPVVEAHSVASLPLRSRPIFADFVRSALGLPGSVVVSHSQARPSQGLWPD